MKNRASIKIAIAIARFNEDITSSLLALCRSELESSGVKAKNISEYRVPGAFELPFAAKKLAKAKKFDAVIVLGCVIKGDTAHDLYVSSWAAIGAGQASLETGVPVIFGVLTPNNEEQARERAKPGELNRGKEMARAALEMVDFAQGKV
jgi:6,7-dimethyl-8-ribityllumazine synthase